MGDSGSPRAIRDSSSSFHFRDIEAHATGTRTIILQHLRAMMLDARGVELLRMFCSRYPIHSPPFCEAADLNVSGTGRRRARPRCTWQCNVVTSPFLTRVECLLNSSWFTVPAPAVCTTCQVSYRASDARSCHSDIHSTFPPKLELGETPLSVDVTSATAGQDKWNARRNAAETSTLMAM